MQSFNAQLFLGMFCVMGVSAEAFADSLWLRSRNNETGLYSSQTASRVGDILFVKVSETLNSDQKLELKSSRTPQGSSDGTMGQFLWDKGVDLLSRNVKPLGQGTATALKAVTGEETFTSSADIKDTRTVEHDFSATVIDVLPNGNLVIEGTRIVTYAGEEWYSTVRGLVRPADIQPDNRVDSTKIADARIRILPRGTLSDSVDKGWLSKVGNAVSPF